MKILNILILSLIALNLNALKLEEPTTEKQKQDLKAMKEKGLICKKALLNDTEWLHWVQSIIQINADSPIFANKSKEEILEHCSKAYRDRLYVCMNDKGETFLSIVAPSEQSTI